MSKNIDMKKLRLHVMLVSKYDGVSFAFAQQCK